MKLWKVLARTSHVYTSHVQNFKNQQQSETFEFKSISTASTSSTSDGNESKPMLQFTPVKLKKIRGESLGIVLNASGNLDSCPSIASLKAGSVALASDQLTPGDRIHSVNGINTSRMRPEEVASLLDNVDGDALIDIEYCLPTYASQSSLCVSSKITEVSVERIDGSLGITLRGGTIPDHPHLSRPLIITQVRPNGAAYSTGLIRVGDRLLSVDNFSLTNKTLLEAQEILKESSLHSVSTLTIEYDVNIMESVKYATGPLLVEIDRNGNEDLGILLTNYDFECNDNAYGGGTFVDHIVPASTADRCGALNAGDQLMAIDNINLDNGAIDLKEAENLLKIATKIQILPLHAVHRISSRGYRLGSFGNGSPPLSGFSTINSRRSKGPKYQMMKNNRHSLISKSLDESANNNYCYANFGVCHSETLNITLNGDRNKGYGFGVATQENDDSSKNSDIIISKVIPDSPAYRCGCLQNGDRIISVNHRTNLTFQEVLGILEMGTDPLTKVTLQIEFDVADTTVPSSGIFTVKLGRRIGQGLGITITASKLNPEEPFVISDIRKGSVAHRTGSLQSGDKLLAIDNRPLDQMSIEAAFDILQNSANDIVTLKVEKMDCRNSVLDTVVYTVELVRHGGHPLGITIAGSEDCMEPIVISRLTEGGLAERTAALHIGDKLVAINGENLEKKPLSEAIRLLQSPNDRVQLKIARSLINDEVERMDSANLGRCNYSSPGLTSIDSAVHSWDSNPNEIEPEISENSIIKDFESVLSDPLNYPESLKSNQLDSQVQFYSDMEDIFCPSPLPLPNYSFTSKYDAMNSSSYGTSSPQVNNFHTPRENTIDQNYVYHVTLFKDSVYDDYGFSVSDGLYEKGVYINRIRKGGPADMVGILKPFDRIIQVNDTKTNEFDCCLTVPLIASAGDRIELVVMRTPHILHNSSFNEGLNRKSFASSNNTITKTL